MSIRVPEPLRFEVGQVADFEARMLRSFRAAVADWDEVCSALGAWEAGDLTKAAPNAAWESHRRWVSELLRWGRLVQHTTKQPEFPEKALAERVAARLRHLEDKLAIWHRQMASAREQRILQAAFQ